MWSNINKKTSNLDKDDISMCLCTLNRLLIYLDFLYQSSEIVRKYHNSCSDRYECFLFAERSVYINNEMYKILDNILDEKLYRFLDEDDSKRIYLSILQLLSDNLSSVYNIVGNLVGKSLDERYIIYFSRLAYSIERDKGIIKYIGLCLSKIECLIKSKIVYDATNKYSDALYEIFNEKEFRKILILLDKDVFREIAGELSEGNLQRSSLYKEIIEKVIKKLYKSYEELELERSKREMPKYY